MKLIISGASRGIGKETAKYFAKKGFNIAFCGMHKETVADVEAMLKKDYGIKAYGFVCNLTVAAEAKKFALDAVSVLGGCDVLINNAGMFAPGSIELEEDGLFEKQMAVNLNTAYYLTRALIPFLRAGERRHIFTLCSIASIKAYPNGSSYCVSKFALLGFTKVLREELKKDRIAVSAVLPGATLTESWGDTDLPPSRFIRTGDIAAAIYNAWSINENSVVEEILIRPLEGDI
jgi:NAD(P)-dependent dehydrogenase (short-subunit alcohol dehydrogenase family)